MSYDTLSFFSASLSCGDSTFSIILNALVTLLGAAIGAIITVYLTDHITKRSETKTRNQVAHSLLLKVKSIDERLRHIPTIISLNNFNTENPFFTRVETVLPNMSLLDLETISLLNRLERELFVLEEFRQKVVNKEYYNNHLNDLNHDLTFSMINHVTKAKQYVIELISKLMEITMN
ncbi:MAG: hypothetical protein ABFC71_03750 [Methanoregula sp.]